MLFVTCWSHDTNSVSNIKSILITWKNNVSLLVSFWSDQSIHFLHFDVVVLLDRLLNKLFVCLLVHEEYQSIVVLNCLNSWLTADWSVNDCELVEGVIFFHCSQWVLWVSRLNSALWSLESCFVPNFMLFYLMRSFLHSGLSLLCSFLYDQNISINSPILKV